MEISNASETKTQNPRSEGAPQSSENHAEGNRPFLMRVILFGFGSLVILAETGLFFLLVPSADEVSALAEDALIRVAVQDEEEAKKPIDETAVEFNLGTFGETFSPIDTPRRFRVEMQIFALVRQVDEAKLSREFEAKQGRLRHTIRMKVRNSEYSELDENQLGILERRILSACNHLLGEELLLGIGFYDYQMIEQ